MILGLFSMASNAPRAAGVIVENDPFFDSRRARPIQLTAQHSIPAIYHILRISSRGRAHELRERI